MDIPVSRLNQRMALQLPAELPLGLVFVVGQVQLPARSNGYGESRPGEFYLRDEDYRLPCRLSKRATAEFRLEEGDRVRAGGHLVFEPVLASYYLLARDIERMDGFRPAAKPLAAIIADNNRREQASSLTPVELPSWVQQMAPPEVRAPQADERLAAGLALTAPQLSGNWELLADTEAAVAYPEAEPALAGMSDDLIAFLSQAMDSEVEVEITPEIMTDLNTTGKTERLSPEVLEALDLFEASVNKDALPQEPDQPEPAAESGMLPHEQVLAWLDEAEAAADLSADQPGEESLSAAEMARALEDAAASWAAGEATQKAPQPKASAASSQRPAAKPAKSNNLIPWYVALLIIVVVAILLAALVYVVMFPESLPFDLSLELPQELNLLP